MLKLELLPREPFDLAEGSTVGDMRPLAATPAAVTFTSALVAAAVAGAQVGDMVD
ncbi:hypothetical protein G3N30_10795 [Microbacterium lacticum]|uniref:hypothetical protein n=1 Tax=Microbacterium lacticum TaxID=33885 RepID=UPI0018B04474|nr:hypothetical protein [Microbacterium lacticum]MBF9336684.1 hypothetical protein [Microbacterium lacticum]